MSSLKIDTEAILFKDEYMLSTQMPTGIGKKQQLPLPNCLSPYQLLKRRLENNPEHHI